MCKSFRLPALPLRGAPALLVILSAAMLFCCRSQAQVVITSSTDVTGLQDALISGATNIQLQFSGTMNPSGVFEIVEDVTIDGTGFSPVLGATNSQVFYVDPGVNFTLLNVTLTGAVNTGTAGTAGVNGGNGGTKGGAGGAGGAGSNVLGGAVYNAGNTRFINCLFLTNSAVGGAGGTGGNGGNGSSTGGNGGNGGAGGSAYGGGLYNIGTVLLSNCTFAGNTVSGGAGAAGGTNGSGPFSGSYPGAGGGGGIGSGAGIYNLGKITIINSTINQNSCVSGSASTSGGGVPSGNGNGVAGPAGASSEGGGVSNYGTNFFLNCTLFANTATGGNGGNGGAASSTGFDGGNGGNGGNGYGGNVFNGTGGVLAMTNCTISGGALAAGTNGTGGTGPNNGQNGSPGGVAGANIANLGTTFLFKNSILDFPTNTTSAYGAITDQGNNLSSDATPTFTTTNSFNSTNPGLSPSGLQANGSTLVLTIALSSTSPAINAIYDGSAPGYDERGFVRPGKIRPDIGAFEFASYSTTYDVTGKVMIGNNPFPGVTVVAGQSASVTDSNGNFALTLPTNLAVIHPNPETYFSPNSITVTVVTNVSGLLFNATNATGTITNVVNGGGTNTNSLNLTFTGIPGFNYLIQAATNFSTNPPTIWTNLSTNLAGSNGVLTFSYTVGGTNLTNYPKRFFRAVPPP